MDWSNLFGYGGFGGYDPWAGIMQSMGGYGGYGGYGSYGGMFGNPYMMGGYSPYMMGGYNPWGMYGGIGGDGTSLESILEGMFKKYFPDATPGEAVTGTSNAGSGGSSGATSSDATATNEDQTSNTTTDKPKTLRDLGDNFGQRYITTGEFGEEGLRQIQEMGYDNAEDFLASDAGKGFTSKRDDYVSNQQKANQANPPKPNPNVKRQDPSTRPRPNTNLPRGR